MDRVQILKDRGFIDDRMRELWFNRDLRKAFSYPAVEDYDSGDFDKYLSEDVPPGIFRFYMYTVPEGFAEEAIAILERLGLEQLRADIPLYRMGVPDRRK